MDPGTSSSISGLVDRASERLASVPGSGERAEQVEALRRFLRLETERLKMRHRAGLGGDEIASGRSHQVDLAVRRVCQLVAAGFSPAAEAELGQTALVALGGYGRAELAPFSDVDVLFLHTGRPGHATRDFVEQALALLWDTGFTVGHSFRSVAECIDIARSDLHSRTAMAEARLLVGSESVFADLIRGLDEAVLRNPRETESFVAALCAETEARYEKYGRSVGLLEPNVKQSAGGLRDLHTILWLGQARLGAQRLEDLRDLGHLTGEEYAALRRARALLTCIRNEAHFLAGRKADQLTLETQPDLAANLGYRAGRGLLASERLMRDYYLRAHELHHVFEGFAARQRLYGGRPGLRSRLRLPGHSARFVAHGGQLHLRPGWVPPKGEAQWVFEAFELAQVRGLGLADDVRVAVRAATRKINARFRRSREASRAFLGLLSRRGQVAPALRAMRDASFLGRFLPEFGRVTFLVQHDQYHRFTVDEHTLKAIEALDEVASAHLPPDVPQELARAMGGLPDAAPLYLALLLHDLGKGRGLSHVPVGARIAARVCERLHLDRSSAEDVVFLVRHHLVMSQMSQRRDLSEQGLIRAFADSVGSLERLDQLLLLTYADTRGVGPAVWNAWKGALLLDLYGRARAALTGRDALPDADWRTRAHARTLADLAGQVPASQVERHLAMLPDRYLRAAGSDDVAVHLRLVAGLGASPVVTEWRDDPRRGHTRLTICTRDAPGVLAQLTGVMTANGLDILAVDVFTREDGIVLDSFTVSELGGARSVAPARRAKVDADLRAAVDRRLDVASAVEERRRQVRAQSRRRTRRKLAPAQVRLDSEASTMATVVEVDAEDEPGLAYRIASGLTALGLDITFAKIASEKNRAWDVFYVVDASGGRLPAERMGEVERALTAALAREKPATEEEE